MIDNISPLASVVLCSSAALQSSAAWDDAWLTLSATDLLCWKGLFCGRDQPPGKLPVTFRVSHKTSLRTVDAKSIPFVFLSKFPLSLIRTAGVCKCWCHCAIAEARRWRRRWKASNKEETAAPVVHAFLQRRVNVSRQEGRMMRPKERQEKEKDTRTQPRRGSAGEMDRD